MTSVAYPRADPAFDLPKRVVLVCPPSTFLLDERVFPSLGILKVAASLEQRGVAVEMIDLSGVSNHADALRMHLQATGARHVGITTTTPQLPATAALVDAIRRQRPDMRVILGGPHPTLVAAAAKLERSRSREGRAVAALSHLEAIVDVIVAGDGELAILSALAPDAPRLIDADDPAGGLFLTRAAYEASPWPARHLIDLASYRYSIEGRPATSLIAQLGCPFGCGFCGGRNSRMLRQIRTRSSDSIVAELEFLYRQYGHTGFMFYDDELNVNRDFLQLLQRIRELQDRLGVAFRLRGFVKAELLTQDQASAMHAAGFRWVLVGFESGAPRILENINKKATREDNDRAFGFARKAGLKVKALMSVGHPGESQQTVLETRDWLLESQPDDFDCTIITTYPGTPYYDDAVPHPTERSIYTYTCARSGDRLHAYDLDFTRTADYYKGDPDGGYRAYVFTDHLSAEQLVEGRDFIERTVRSELHLPFNASRPALSFDHSMGMANALPPFILRKSQDPGAGDVGPLAPGCAPGEGGKRSS